MATTYYANIETEEMDLLEAIETALELQWLNLQAGVEDMGRVILKIDGSSGNYELETAMALIFAKVFSIWKKKQHDYGPQNVAMAGQRGIAGRANDKLQRLLNLGNEEPNNESILDSWLDLCDYGAIGAALHLGVWPKGDVTDITATITFSDGTTRDLTQEEVERLLAS